MRNRKFFIPIATTVITSVLGGVLGIAIGSFLFSKIITTFSTWKQFEIISAPEEAKNIAHFDIYDIQYDPTGDELYVETKRGKIYSISLFSNEWGLFKPTHAWENSIVDKCATEWSDQPPIKNKVIDSAGVRLERPSFTFLRCYVLLEHGKLQVWTRIKDETNLIFFDFLGGLLGVFFGYKISNLIVKRLTIEQPSANQL